MFLCTANVCRSPIAEAVLRARLGDRVPRVSVSSAGFLGTEGPADARTAEVIRARGLPVPQSVGRVVHRTLLAGADLVIGMARHHVREAVVFERSVFPRSFTLKELVTRAGALGPRRAGEPVEGFLDRLHQGRSMADLLDASGVVDIADPVTTGARSFERTAVEIEQLVDRLVALLWPEGASSTDGLARTAGITAAGPGAPPGGARSLAGTLTLPGPVVNNPVRMPAAEAAPPAGARLVVGADRAGSRLKAALVGHLGADGQVVEIGTGDFHYADVGASIGHAVAAGVASMGLCICGTGAGTAMAANRVPGARAAVIHDATSARLARHYNDANIICIGSRQVSVAVAWDAVDAFLRTPFDKRYAADVARLSGVDGYSRR